MTLNNLAAGEEPNPLVPHLSEIILVLIIFGILYYLIWKYVVPRFEANFAAAEGRHRRGYRPGGGRTSRGGSGAGGVPAPTRRRPR